MASAMSLVRIAPEAPTRAPAMIRTGLLITKPAIAAAVPVNEFRSEITTGMSAPPIGSTIVMPKISAAARITSITGMFERAGRRDRTAAAITVIAASAKVDDPAAGDQDRLAADRALELAGRDQRAGERDRADDDVEDDEDRRVETGGPASAWAAEVVVDRDQGRRAAADRVEQRHQLRHRGHLHGARGVQPEPAAERDAGHDDRPAADDRTLRRASAQRDQDGGRDDRERHAGGRQPVAVARGRGRVHLDGGRGRTRQRPPARRARRGLRSSSRVSIGFAYASASASAGFGAAGFFLNIWSIRSVTT